MVNIIRLLLPKEEEFFLMLIEQSENVLAGAKELKDFVDNYSKLKNNEKDSKVKIIKDLEHKGDDITHKIIEKLNKTFITPIDKEDIHHLANLLDDLIDLITAVAYRFVLLKIEKIDRYISKQVDIILEAVKEVNKNLHDLKSLKQVDGQYVKIETLENEADDVYRKALSELFRSRKKPVDIIKYKEVYEILEKISNKCEEVTHIMESVVVKHA